MIQKLDEALIVRIAAGEVIERPASVVKELVENSIDAGSHNIIIRIERGGLGLIEVSDDGCGIESNELLIALERHATSKLKTADDLDCIMTMGFRGEALATIASAGRLTIISRTKSASGAKLEAEGGSIEPAARDCGTTVIVRDLFAKVPARLKFMKLESAEASRISELLERLAIARPEISFELIRDGKRIFRTGGRNNLREAIAEIFGGDLAKDLLGVESGSIAGLISPSHVTRRNRTGFFYNLNGRPIEDRTIAHAVTSAYDGLLPGGQFPVVFMTISLDPSEADVNVHPAKAEVRFRDSQRVHKIVSQTLRERLRQNVPLPTMSVATPAAPFAPQRNEEPRPAVQQPVFDAIWHTDVEAPRNVQIDHRGEIRGRYLLAEDADGLVVIDQHAAHERVMFDHLMRDAQNGSVVSAPFLVPITIEMASSDRALMEELIGHFAEVGFEIEVWPGAIAVRSAPAVMSDCDIAAVIRDTLDVMRAGGESATLKVPYARLAMEACKSAVKGTQRLDPAEARALLADLVATTDPYNCPHGRPTMVRISVDELDKRFGRT